MQLFEDIFYHCLQAARKWNWLGWVVFPPEYLGAGFRNFRFGFGGLGVKASCDLLLHNTMGSPGLPGISRDRERYESICIIACHYIVAIL